MPGVEALQAPAAIEWPQGGLQWTDGLRAALPPVRGVRAVALPDAAGLWDEAVVLADVVPGGIYGEGLTELARAAGRDWVPWSGQRSGELMRREWMGVPDAEFWLELCAQAAALPVARTQDADEMPHDRWYRGLTWVTRAGLALHGLPFMVELALQMGPWVYQGGWLRTRPVVETALFGTLRAAITACSEAEHAAVIGLLQAQGGSPAHRLVRACLCAHRVDWVEASLADGLDHAVALLAGCALRLETARSLLEHRSLTQSQRLSLLLLQFHLHGMAAFELLAQQLRQATDRRSSEALLEVAACVQAPEQIGLLVELMDRQEVRAVLERVAVRHAAAVLKTAIEHVQGRRSPLVEGWTVRLALRHPAARAQAVAALAPDDGRRFQALLHALQGDEAAPEQVPPVLREPPWLARTRAAEPPVLDLTPRVPAERMTWTEPQRAQWAAWPLSPLLALRLAKAPAEVARRLRISDSGYARLMRGQPLLREDAPGPQDDGPSLPPEAVLALPDGPGLALWNSYPPECWSSGDEAMAQISAILARHGLAALPGLVRYAQVHPVEGLCAALPVDSARLVPVALYALHHVKRAQAPAGVWLRSHPATAVAAALPLAFAKDRIVRQPAQAGLRWLAQQGFDEQARQAAAAYGPSAVRALQAVLDADPLWLLPARMPRLPDFVVAPALRRPQLHGGGLLPVAALEHMATMLLISAPDQPYAGLAQVRQACTPESLARFAWDLFEAWLAAGAPSRHGWAFAALGLLGNDDTVHRLLPLIREWPGQSALQRALAGLDVLAAIGTDFALMQLHGLAARAKSKGLRDRARGKLAALAQARGLGPDELADRLVPDLGLQADGTLTLDFGPRRFQVGFDEALHPFVKDAQGVRLKALPRPAKIDDAALAAAATARYQQVKKEARAVASLQVARLEQAMVHRRRWTAAEFRRLFLAHPLMRHLAARLVWSVHDNGPLVAAFRVAEDRTLADAHDALYELPATASVGIAHVLELPAPLQAAFGQILADYEVLQPFRQLGRETYLLTAQEQQAAELQRFAGRTVATGPLLGLLSRGWERGPQSDGAWVGGICRRLPGGLEAQLLLDPGLELGSPTAGQGQRLAGLLLCEAGASGSASTVAFGRLDPILASEVLRDVALLPLLEV